MEMTVYIMPYISVIWQKMFLFKFFKEKLKKIDLLDIKKIFKLCTSSFEWRGKFQVKSTFNRFKYILYEDVKAVHYMNTGINASLAPPVRWVIKKFVEWFDEIITY